MTTGFEIDDLTHSIVIRRSINAAPERLYAAWLTPASIGKWWDADGRPLAECSIDARENGRFRFVTSDHSFPFEGVYTRLVPPSEISFDALGASGTVLFERKSGGTDMTLRIRCASADHLAQFVAMGVAEGTVGTVANLIAHLAAQTESAPVL